MAVIAKVAVQAATYAIDKAYDYLLPEEVGGQAAAGCWCPSAAATGSQRR